MSNEPIWREAGKNDAGVPEGVLVRVLIPIRLPEKKIFRRLSTGDLFDSDGKIQIAAEPLDTA